MQPKLLPLLSASCGPRIVSHSGNSHLLIKLVRFDNIEKFLKSCLQIAFFPVYLFIQPNLVITITEKRNHGYNERIQS